MGFSLKKLLENTVNAVNPFDNGKTWSNPQGNPKPVKQAPAQTPAPQGNMNFAGSKTYGTFNRPSPVVNLAQKQIAQTPKVNTKNRYAQVNAPSYGSGLSGILNRAKDVVDANTPQDQFKRNQQTKAPLRPNMTYQQQQQVAPSNLTRTVNLANSAKNNAITPMATLTKAAVGQVTGNQQARNNALNTYKQGVQGNLNTLNSFKEGIIGSSKQIGTGLAYQSKDFQNAQKAQSNLVDIQNQQKLNAIKRAKQGFNTQQDVDRFVKYADNLWQNEAEARQNQINIQKEQQKQLEPKKNAFAIADAVSTALSFGIAGPTKNLAQAAGKQAFQQALEKGLTKQVATQVAKKAATNEIIRQSALTGSMGGFQGAINPYITKDPGTITPTDVITGAVSGGVMGGVLPGAFVAASSIKKPVQNAFNRLSIDNQIGAIGKNVKDDLAPQVGKTPLKMTEEQYLARNGAGFMDGSEPALHRQPNKRANAQKRDVMNTMAAMDKNNAKRAELRKEYQAKVARGEIEAPSRIDTLIQKANGLPELESTQAARRLLEKQGIDWNAPTTQVGKTGATGTAKPNRPPQDKIGLLQAQTQPQSSVGEVLSTQLDGQRPLLGQKIQQHKISAYPDNTPLSTGKQPTKNPVIKEYAKMLKEYDDMARGGDMIPDGKGGYKRITNHSKFYSDYFKINKSKPNQEAWYREAERQLQNGRGDSEFQKAFDDFSNPELRSLDNTAPGQEVSPLEQNKFNANALKKEIQDFRKGLVKIKQPNKESNIAVSKVTQKGDTITKTNVNPNIKKGEKTFSIGPDGELMPDTKGAYRLFTDDDGKITSFRIGDKVYDSKDFGDLADVNNYGSTIATMRRNIERAFGKNKKTGDALQKFIVDHQQHQATKMIERQVAFRDGMKNIANDLGINFQTRTGKAKKVSAAIQDFGEGNRDKASLVKEFGQDTANKIESADKWFRSQYDTLLKEANDTLTKYGYDPIPKRNDYYTHFQDPTVWQNFGLKMQEIRDMVGSPMQEANPNGVRGGIPATLAGQSEYLQPNKRFNPFALERKGGAYTSDAFKAFEKYLTPTLNNIYMTPSIARTRIIAKAIAQQGELAGTNPNKLVVQMREWANHLAGKTNRIGDRQAADSDWASKALQGSQWVQRKVGQQSIVGNLATAVMQPVVLAQTAAKAGFKNTLLGLMQEFPGAPAHAKSAPIKSSEFLRRRYLNTTPVTATKGEVASNIAGTPLKVIEETAGRVTWSSFYNQALEKGLKGKEAINFADTWAEKTMAGRAIGEKPELYRSNTAAFATQFQLEVNNMWQQLGREYSKADVARFVVAAYGMNMAIQQVIGRQPAFNPLDAAIDSVVELANSEDTSQEKAIKIGQRIGGEIAGSVPILPQILDTFMDDADIKKVFGTQTPVGRFGVGSTVGSLWDNTGGKIVDKGVKGIPEAGAYVLTPFGYNQAQKTYKGLKAVADGQLTNKDGQTTVEIPQTPKNWIKGGLFGPSAIPEVNAYYNNIGLKKEDQKPVPNQTSSVAGRQGGATPQLSLDDQRTEAKNTIKKLYGKDWANMSESDIADKARNGDQKALEIYNSLQAQEKVYAKPNMPTPGLSKDAEDILNSEKKFTATGRKAWGNRPTESKVVKETLKSWTGVDLPVTNDVAVDWAKFKQKQAKGEFSPLEENEAKLSLARKAVSSQLSEDERQYYNVADDKLLDALSKGWIKPDSLAKAMDIDKQLLSMGLTSKSGFGKKIWNALGIAYPSVSGASSGTRRSSGRRSTRTAKAPKLKFTTTRVKNRQKSFNSSLRKLLASAKV